jgi:hypothetical protein
MKLVLTLTIPAIFLFSLGVPLGFLSQLRKEKHNLDDLSVREKFGFLYGGYSYENYYWEIVIMLRKVMLVLATVLSKMVGNIPQGLLVYLVISVFLSLNIYKQPFATKTLTNLESASLLVSLINIYCGLFLATQEQDNSECFDESKDCKFAI